MTHVANWLDAAISGVIVRDLDAFRDERGWLMELFRRDESDGAAAPAMGYVSLTHPGVSRGPHEHRGQTDRFAFFDGRYTVFLWDARQDSPTVGHRMVFSAGRGAAKLVIIPPGVVHAYRNDGPTDALVTNFPDTLYAGEGKREEVDEIRHEDLEDTPFRMVES